MRPRPDLRAADGPPLSTGQLSALTGLSDDTIRREIAAGELLAFRSPGGHLRIYWRSARAWAIRLGVYRVRSSSPQTPQMPQVTA